MHAPVLLLLVLLLLVLFQILLFILLFLSCASRSSTRQSKIDRPPGINRSPRILTWVLSPHREVSARRDPFGRLNDPRLAIRIHRRVRTRCPAGGGGTEARRASALRHRGTHRRAEARSPGSCGRVRRPPSWAWPAHRSQSQRNSALDRPAGWSLPRQPDRQRAVGRSEREEHQRGLRKRRAVTREVQPEPSAWQRTQREQVIEQVQLQARPRIGPSRRRAMGKAPGPGTSQLWTRRRPTGEGSWRDVAHRPNRAAPPNGHPATHGSSGRGSSRPRRSSRPRAGSGCRDWRRLDLIDPAEVGGESSAIRADVTAGVELTPEQTSHPGVRASSSSRPMPATNSRVGQVEIMRPTSRQSSATR